MAEASCVCPLSSPMLEDATLLLLARITVCMNYVTIVGCGLWACRTALHTDTGEIKSLLSRCLGMLASLARSRPSSSDEETMKVEEVLSEMRGFRSSSFIRLLLAFAVWISFVYVRRFHELGVWSDAAESEVTARLLLPSHALTVLFTTVAVAFTLWCSQASSTLIHLVFVTVSSCELWLQHDVLQFLAHVRFSHVGRVLFAAICGRAGLVAMLSTVFSVSAAVRRWTSEPLSNAPAFAFGSTIVLMEVCAAFMTDWGMRAVAQANVAVMVASSSEGAMKELLNIMCDAVVQVDESLMLTTSSVRLDALLLRTPHVDAESFTSLLDDTSKGRFVEFANRNERLPQSLHVQFRGERGVFFRAQLFHVRFENVAGRVGHLIGIVEESGGTPRAMPLISASLWQTRRHSRTSATSGTDLEHDSGSDRSGLISTSSSDSNFLAIQAVDREDVVALWVDTGSSNLRIRSCTASFTSYSGAMPEGQSFLKLLRRRHRASVLQWIRDAAASTGNDDADRAAHPHRLAMRFRTTGGAVEVEAKCNVQPTRRGTACLEFSDLVICDPNGRPEPQASSRRGTSSRFIKRLRL